MNFDIEPATIYKVRHGSWAYGLNTPESDVDIKGVCVEPLEYHYGFLHHFENLVEETSKGYPTDLVIYSLKKFARLCADANPNVLEVLFVEDEDVLFINEFGQRLRDFRDNFLSKKAFHSCTGAAYAQIKRIKSHRSWLLNPPKEPPTREQFGLPTEFKMSKSELGAFEALVDKEGFAELSREALTLYTREKAYKNKRLEWDQYQGWLKTRNAKRAELEAKYFYDTKYALNAIRWLKVSKELLETGKVNIKRKHDREELMSIRNGAMKYENLIEYAEKLEAECKLLYDTSTVLPKAPNLKKIDEFVVQLTEDFLSRGTITLSLDMYNNHMV